MISEWVCTIVSLTKEHPWAEFLTNLPRRGVGTLPSVSEFNHERVPMSCLQWLDALKVNIWTSNNVQRSHQQLWSQLLTTHNTLDSMSMVYSGHQLKVCSVFVLHCEPFRSIFTESPVFAQVRLLTQQLLASARNGEFSTWHIFD